ncbi:hypothetical protein [Leptospira sp. 'Mane']|uniref:hypothetical protein n=1 Tax=Leptospira sp. 'Mane' TaxID=3387407 RepID=UPI00398A8F89
MKLRYLLTFFLCVLFICMVPTNIIYSESADTFSKKLEARGYKINYEKKIGGVPYRITADSRTKVENDDFLLICSIPTITTIKFEKVTFPEKISEHINACAEKKINRVIFSDTDISKELICEISKLKGISELSFRNANLNNQSLECLSSIKQIDLIDLLGVKNSFDDEGFCKFAKSPIKIRSLGMYESYLGKQGYDCLLDFQTLESISVRKWKNFSKEQMDAIALLYSKKYGKKIIIDSFDYDRPK